MNFTTAFITGITTGGLTCLAVQGGLLIGVLALRTEDGEEPHGWRRLIMPVAAFLVAKIAIHTLLGFGLGWFGSSIALTPTIRIWLQVIAGVFMLVTGIRLIAPGFLPWLTLMPPSAVRRFVRKNAKSQSLIAPFVLGLLTILIPCGTTQALEISAIATGNALRAAGIMFGFTLGTAPLFLIVGVLAKGTALLQKKMAYLAAAVVVFLGLMTLNSALVLTDSPYEFHNVSRSLGAALFGNDNSSDDATKANNNPTIGVSGSGYSPDEVTVNAGIPVAIKLVAKASLGCTGIFRIPQLNIEQSLTPSQTTTITATFPSPGRYTFTCGMGMYRGTIIAI